LNSPDFIHLLKALIVTIHMFVVYQMIYNPPKEIHPIGRELVLASGVLSIMFILGPVLFEIL